MASSADKSNLFHTTVSKRIESIGPLHQALRAGGTATFADEKFWDAPSKFLKEANKLGQKVPVIFSTNADRNYAFGWAVLTSVEKHPNRYTFSNLVEFHEPVHFDDLPKYDLGSSSKIGTRQTTSRPYNLIPTPYDRFIEVVNEAPSPNPKEVPPPSDPADRCDVGAGFGNPEQNREVEEAAIAFVMATYRKKDFVVVRCDRENLGYDLRATLGQEELHLEVKGVQGALPDFIITANEVETARTDSQWRVAIVVNALEDSRQMIDLSGTEFLRQYDLRPISYRAVKKRQTP